MKIEICHGKTCGQSNRSIVKTAEEEKGGNPNIKIDSCGCMKKCSAAPNIKVKNERGERIHGNMTPEKMKRIIKSSNQIQGGDAKKKLSSFLSGGF